MVIDLSREEKLNIMITVIMVIVTFVASATAFVFLWIKKPVVIERNYALDEVLITENSFDLKLEQGKDGALTFKLPTGFDRSGLSFSYDYLGGKLHISMGCNDVEYFKTCVILCDPQFVSGGQCTVGDNVVHLDFDTENYLACDCNVSGDEIIASFMDVKSRYDFVCLIDPEYDDEFGESIYAVASRTSEIINDSNVGVLVAGRQNECPYESDDELRPIYLQNLSERINADAVISLDVSRRDSEEYGFSAYYNEQFFNSELKNISVADRLVRSLAEECSNRALGVFEASEDDEYGFLYDLTVPSAMITIGNVNNEKERKLLSDSGYIEKMAKSLAASIKELYEQDYLCN